MPGRRRSRSRCGRRCTAPWGGRGVRGVSAAGDRVHQEGRPPAMNNRINSVMRLTETHWAGAYKEFSISCGAGERDGYTDCADAVPVLVTPLAGYARTGPRLGLVLLRPSHLAASCRRPRPPRRGARLPAPPARARPSPPAAAVSGSMRSGSPVLVGAGRCGADEADALLPPGARLPVRPQRREFAADDSRRATDALVDLTSLPSGLTTLHWVISEALLPGVGSGCFIRSPATAAEHFREYGPFRLTANDRACLRRRRRGELLAIGAADMSGSPPRLSSPAAGGELFAIGAADTSGSPPRPPGLTTATVSGSRAAVLVSGIDRRHGRRWRRTLPPVTCACRVRRRRRRGIRRGLGLGEGVAAVFDPGRARGRHRMLICRRGEVVSDIRQDRRRRRHREVRRAQGLRPRRRRRLSRSASCDLL